MLSQFEGHVKLRFFVDNGLVKYVLKWLLLVWMIREEKNNAHRITHSFIEMCVCVCLCVYIYIFGLFQSFRGYKCTKKYRPNSAPYHKRSFSVTELLGTQAASCLQFYVNAK